MKKKLFKTTIEIWTEYDGTAKEIDFLAAEAMGGNAICTMQVSQELPAEFCPRPEFFDLEDYLTFGEFLEHKGFEGLDDLVQDAAGVDEFNLNNEGVIGQVEYLITSGAFASFDALWNAIGHVPGTSLEEEFSKFVDANARALVEAGLADAGIIEDPDMDGGLLG